GKMGPPPYASQLELVHRNGLRLLKLVNTLLDFSQAESHREQARFEPTDLAALTTDIASAFRSAIETAGLRFDVRCDRGMPEVWVDRQMWEKIVSNLLSNALKFTFEGEITVELKPLSLHAELVVKDTGVGVPAHEIPNLFKRFHRVRGTRARTAEGSGIGLSMVHDFVTRLSGQVRAVSKVGIGTRFTIWIPLKSLRAGAGPLPAEDGFRPTEFASQVAREASRWSADSDPTAGAPGGVLDDVFGPPHALAVPGKDSPAGRVLVVDDNADMRAYLERLLSPRWRVEVAADGGRAFDVAVELLPDLILADVMMPGLDGFELLKKIRAHPGLRHTPVVLVTARAGEEAAIEGLLAGADDYIAKPFSARELIARVGGQLELARARRRTAELNELLVRFSDAVRGLVDPHEVARTALRMVAEHFGAEEAYLAEVDWTTREYVVEDVYLRAGGGDLPSLVGRLPHDAWEPRTSYYLANRSMVTDDARVDDRLSDALKAGFAARGIRAHISVPVAVDGQLRAVLGVNPGSPRHWTPEDVALVEGVAGRCWSEVERVRAEAAVRESEEKYRVLFDTMGEGYGVIEVVRDAAGRAVDLRYLEFNRSFERLSGMARAQLLGRRAGDGFLRADIERWLPVFAQVVQTGEPATFEQHLEGTDRWYEGSAYPRGGDRVSLFYRDVTERKRAGAELLARNEELERFHNTTVGPELRMIELKNRSTPGGE
ncbi:MAG TPA: response regulator, partial [Gemmatimonadaceae bacterium]